MAQPGTLNLCCVCWDGIPWWLHSCLSQPCSPVLSLGLILCSYVKFKTEHNPTSEGIEAGAKTARMKIKLVGGLLKLAGKQREYR